MNDRVLSRDDQRAREYSTQIHRLDHEPVQDEQSRRGGGALLPEWFSARWPIW